MPTDKSSFHYGAIYHRLFDPPLADARRVAIDLISEESSVVDLGCGTGQLCFALRSQKRCRVVGVDLSLRMLEFARKSNPFQDVTFLHGDATELGGVENGSFDYATMLMIMHELPLSQQVRLLTEALRVAKRGIVVDSVVPLPVNAAGVGIRAVEAIFGHDHNANFRSFLSAGGVSRILQKSGLAITVEHSSVFWRGCREVVVVSTHPS